MARRVEGHSCAWIEVKCHRFADLQDLIPVENDEHRCSRLRFVSLSSSRQGQPAPSARPPDAQAKRLRSDVEGNLVADR